MFQLGSMSHFLNTRVPGYQDLPSFPESAPGNLSPFRRLTISSLIGNFLIVLDPSVRNIEPPRAPNSWAKSAAKYEEKIKKESSSKKKEKKEKKEKKSFYSEEESGSESDSGTSDSERSELQTLIFKC